MNVSREVLRAKPHRFKFRLETTALLLIGTECDFVDSVGFDTGRSENDNIFQHSRDVASRTLGVLHAWRKLGAYVFCSREQHTLDPSDLPPAKRLGPVSATSERHSIHCADNGSERGRVGHSGHIHNIGEELQPVFGEVVINKPGQDLFWNTSFHRALLARGITHLMIAGITTEYCHVTTLRGAAERGFEYCVLQDCTAGFDPAFVKSLCAGQGSFEALSGFVAPSTDVLEQVNDLIDQQEDHLDDSRIKSISLVDLKTRYANRSLRPLQVIEEVRKRIESYKEKDPAVWLYLRPHEELLQAANDLEKKFRGKTLPSLFGIPFAIKDNIDVADITTTAACEAYAYIPDKSAPIIDALIEAGAIWVGKTNLDQLATGLSGTRSPFGTPKSVYGNGHIPGGSSSGSAVAVGAQLVSFALGSDTAGSGRVPAAYNGITGFKPTKGTLSARGIVPAAKSLDTASILTQTADEARTIWLVLDQGQDLSDSYSKPQHSLPVWQVDSRGAKDGGFIFGIPPENALQTCSTMYQHLFTQAWKRLQRAGGTPHEVDWRPFAGANRLVYQGALMSERITCIGHDFLNQNLEKLHPATSQVFRSALNKEVTPTEIFRDLDLQAQYTRQVEQIFQQIDVLIVPSAPFHPTIAEVEADPLALVAKLGDFAPFANVLDLCGIAMNANFYSSDLGDQLPFSITLLSASGMDGRLLDVAREFERTD